MQPIDRLASCETWSEIANWRASRLVQTEKEIGASVSSRARLRDQVTAAQQTSKTPWRRYES